MIQRLKPLTCKCDFLKVLFQNTFQIQKKAYNITQWKEKPRGSLRKFNFCSLQIITVNSLLISTSFSISNISFSIPWDI